MAIVSCPKCNTPNHRSGFAVWVILVCIVFFPFGLFALLAGRKPTRCFQCGFAWQA